MATWDRYRNDNRTGFETETYTGGTYTPRAYCDDPSAGNVYTTKPPVCYLSLDPIRQILGQPIAFDIGDSMSATSTVDTFTIDFGGATDIGDITDADFNLDPTSGDVVYDDLGTYTVEAFVTDVLGVDSQHVEMTVEIVEPTERLYIGTTDLGVFLADNGDDPAASNAGLSGDDLKLRSIRLNSHYADLDADEQHVWIVTKTGLAYNTAGGTGTWTKITEATLGTPANSAGDDPAPTASDLDQADICFCPQDNRRLYLVRFTTTPERAWLYWSDDYGESWQNNQVGV